jgi:superfamily II DNA or RNA helicase
MPLRPYQVDLENRVRQAYREGCRSPCIVLPCGGGKSVIIADIARQTTAKGNRVLFLVHRRELCDQIRSTFTWWGVNMRLCDIMMVQTAARRLSKLPRPQLIITDENHHCLANTYRKIYEYFPECRRVGVTATPVRLNGDGLGDVNDRLIIGVSAKWLIENHCLAPYDYYAPSLVDLSEAKISRGEFDASSVEKLMLKKAVFGNVIEYYRKLADGKQAICYCTSIRHSIETAAAFCSAGIEAEHIDGSTPKAERDEIVRKFKDGALDILCNVDLISEGFDVPDCECAILLRPTQSLTLYIQQAMRCMRYRPGKRAVIIDHVGNYARHGLPDDDRKWSLEKKPKQKKVKKAETEDNTVTQCPECFLTFHTRDENGEIVRKCPYCGADIPVKERKEIEKKEAELSKIEGFRIDYSDPDSCKSYNELLLYANKHGYKPGWAYYQAKKRGMLHDGA